eukprot:Opistho-2@90411
MEERPVESQFVLRLPEPNAKRLRERLKSGAELGDDDVTIEFDAESRDGRVLIGGKGYAARLYDLPCIIESQKSLDGIHFYKTGDISQMLLCDDGAALSREGTYWPDGLTPPMRAAKALRFRPNEASSFLRPDAERLASDELVDREVARLLRADAMCTASHYYIPGDMPANQAGMAAAGAATVGVAEADVDMADADEEDDEDGRLSDTSNFGFDEPGEEGEDFPGGDDGDSENASSAGDDGDGDFDDGEGGDDPDECARDNSEHYSNADQFDGPDQLEEAAAAAQAASNVVVMNELRTRRADIAKQVTAAEDKLIRAQTELKGMHDLKLTKAATEKLEKKVKLALDEHSALTAKLQSIIDEMGGQG